MGYRGAPARPEYSELGAGMPEQSVNLTDTGLHGNWHQTIIRGDL